MDDEGDSLSVNPLKRGPESEPITSNSKRGKRDKKQKKSKKSKKSKKKSKKSSVPLELNPALFDTEPVPVATYNPLDPHNIAKEARVAELTPWSSQLKLEKAEQVAGRTCWNKAIRSEEHTSELQSRLHLVCPLLL